MKNFFLTLLCIGWVSCSFGQTTFPNNGAPVQYNNAYAFTNMTLQVDPYTVIENATLIVRKGKVEAIGSRVSIPADAIVYDMEGHYIYPSFFDPHSDYGTPEMKREPWKPDPQTASKKQGPFNWNQAIHPESLATDDFKGDPKKAHALRKAGFGSVLTHNPDGIMRGSALVTSLADEKENETILKANAAAELSFNKGSSRQEYPGSLMGTIALLRQTYYDAKWYKQGANESNMSLEAVLAQEKQPTVFSVRDKLSALRAYKVGQEFGYDYIIAGQGDEYQRMEELKAMGMRLIVPVNYPKAFDVEDAYDAMNVTLAEMKHWELAPSNAAFLEEQGIPFAFTASGLQNPEDFLGNVRLAVGRGLTQQKALEAMTTIPAEWFGVSHKIGTLQTGMVANFIVMDGPLFGSGTVIENWVQGQSYTYHRNDLDDVRGEYNISVEGHLYALAVTGKKDKLKGTVTVIDITETFDSLTSTTVTSTDTAEIPAQISRNEHNISVAFTPNDRFYDGPVLLSGNINFDSGSWDGRCHLPEGKWGKWTAVRSEKHDAGAPDTASVEVNPTVGQIWYPNMAYGDTVLPKQELLLIKNATVWTSESEGILANTDVLIRDGKIAQIGTGLSAADARVIDGKGMHLTPGIIDEHTHIGGSGGINEGSQASSAEVRIGDIITSDDINIYRQLSMGTTSAQILHGSANPIGGQSALIKMRWGSSPEDMKIDTKDGFIKFALGENVKQTNWGAYYTFRFPQTRMGVEQVYYDHFLRAREYEAEWNTYRSLGKKAKLTAPMPRTDLEMECILEILNKQRFVSCHSYIQSEINMLMHVADSMDFTLNTFTHILEGYKVADKMAAHGAGGSTFSDWWAYKYEVKDAIPYNAAIMHNQGVVVAINSDDAEMGRRLNQEAAKGVKYGGMSEEDALKMVTINPAKLLHIDDQTGSVKTGKAADLVLWNDNPLSIYAVCQMTIIDGIVYFDKSTKEEKEAAIAAERARLIQAMLEAKHGGAATQKPRKKHRHLYHCDSIEQEDY